MKDDGVNYDLCTPRFAPCKVTSVVPFLREVLVVDREVLVWTKKVRNDFVRAVLKEVPVVDKSGTYRLCSGCPQ